MDKEDEEGEYVKSIKPTLSETYALIVDIKDTTKGPFICKVVEINEVDNIVIQSTHSVAFLAVLKVNVSEIAQPDPLIYHSGSYLDIQRKY